MIKGIAGGVLASSLLVGTIFSATITDSFLHQGLQRDCLIFYTDVSVKTRVYTVRNGDQTRTTITLVGVRAAYKKLLSRLNQKETRGYQLNCAPAGHDIDCVFEYPHDLFTVHVVHEINWHNIATVVITCERATLLPATGAAQKLIVLDAGHGGEQSGAVGLFGLVEKNLTLLFCKKLRACLTMHGYQVLLTRDGDYSVPLDDRTSLANLHHATLLISIHCNYAQNNQVRGIETLYSTPTSRKLAQFIHEQLAQIPLAGLVDRGVKTGLLQTLYGCECPAVLIELFFLSNVDDARLIQDEHTQDLIIARLCAAINQFVA